MTIFRIDQSIFEVFPSARFSAVIARGIDNRASVAESAVRLRSAEESLRTSFHGIDPKAHPNIAVWREAFGSRGWAPSKYLSSIEALVRRVSRGGTLPSINPSDDLANSVSLTHLVPVGAHDLSTAPGSGIVVRLAELDDTFRPMGDGADEHPAKNEIVYAHDSDVRTRRWVWRQSRTGLVRESSTDVLFPVDGFSPSTDQAVRAAAEQLAELVRSLLGGEVSVSHLDPTRPIVDD